LLQSSFTNKEQNTKKIAKAQNVTRATIGSIVGQFGITGWGRKGKLTMAATRFLRR